MGIFNFGKADKPNSQQLGNVTPDKVNIQSSTGRPYPPQMSLTQPGEYGLRVNAKATYMSARESICQSPSKSWSAPVSVKLVNGTLEVSHNGVILGVVSSSQLKEHDAIVDGVKSSTPFRGAVSPTDGYSLRIFMKL
jgi:hypothetical protein